MNLADEGRQKYVYLIKFALYLAAFMLSFFRLEHIAAYFPSRIVERSILLNPERAQINSITVSKNALGFSACIQCPAPAMVFNSAFGKNLWMCSMSESSI